MARLIIGTTTHNSTRIWVRGDERHPFGFVRLIGPTSVRNPQPIELEARHFYTGCIDFQRLKPDTEYRCSVTFGENASESEPERAEFGNCSGRLRTFPALGKAQELTFLFGSCNLHSLGVVSHPSAPIRS